MIAGALSFEDLRKDGAWQADGRETTRIFYYPGAQFDTALLIQSFLMIAIQLILLKIALDHRPPPSSKGGEAATPFTGIRDGLFELQRPFNFWQWRSPKPYVTSNRVFCGGIDGASSTS